MSADDEMAGKLMTISDSVSDYNCIHRLPSPTKRATVGVYWRGVIIRNTKQHR